VRIEDWMKFPVHFVRPLDSIAQARAVLEQFRINQLPVVVDDRLVGIVTDRDLRSASPSVAETAAIDAGTVESLMLDPEKTPIAQVMTEHVLTLTPKDSVEQATRVLLKERIGAIPIVEKDRLVGIVCRSDMLGAFLGVLSSGAVGASDTKPARAPQAKSKASRSKTTSKPKKTIRPAKKSPARKPKKRAKR
jgi:acetoin utilization protein AcuB